jgi:hypothetical protein
MDESTVRVPLTVERRAEIGDKLAGLVERIKGVKAEAKGKAFAFRGCRRSRSSLPGR